MFGKRLPLLHLILSILLITLGCIIAWFNILNQQEKLQVNLTGVEVTGTVIFKRQVMRSSGRGSSYINVFTVYYFDKVPEEDRQPIVLEAFGKQIELGKGRPYIGDFYSYDIENISNALYDRTHTGDPVSILYLPGKPEKVWLKEAVADQTQIFLFWPLTLIGGSLIFSTILTIDGYRKMPRSK
ncbi:MAG: hypothetical protein AAF629_20850 [Chloroflexota bacterium]